MSTTDWLESWREGRIGFHLDRVNPWLLRHQDDLGEPGRVLVPLCGKSLDMGHLAESGWRVTGVDVAEQALAEFFAERGARPERRPPGGVPDLPGGHGRPPRPGGHGILSAGRIDLIAADFLHLTPADLGTFDAAWDRAALIALAPGVRPRYAAHLLSFLKPGGRILLATFEYDQALMDGPPYSVEADEVQRLFPGCDVELRIRRPQAPNAPLRVKHGLPEIHDAVWLITLPG